MENKFDLIYGFIEFVRLGMFETENEEICETDPFLGTDPIHAGGVDSEVTVFIELVTLVLLIEIDNLLSHLDVFLDSSGVISHAHMLFQRNR